MHLSSMRLLSQWMLLLLCLGVFAAPAAAQPPVVIDPGHGGRDPGAVGCGLHESDVALDVSLRAAALLRAQGIRIEMTRDDDTFPSLSARSSFANSLGATRFVSVHANSNAGTPATGTETYVYTSASSTSRNMARSIQREVVAAWGLRDRGVKTAGFHVIRATSMPAALHELGFINNCSVDARLLGDSARREEAARAIARGVLESLGRSTDLGPTPMPMPEPEPEPEPEPGRARGAVFEDTGLGEEDMSTRLGGSQVLVVETGTRVTTAGDGSFSIGLAPGTYTLEASADGFESARRSCVVTTGDAWCSVGLNRSVDPTPPPSTGDVRIRGVVFEETGAGIADTTRRIEGATLILAGADQTGRSAAAGVFEFSAAPGTYILEAQRSGYYTSRRVCRAEGAEVWCAIAMTRRSGFGTIQGTVYERGRTSRRIVGANLTVLENNMATASAVRSGFWRLRLPPGTYTMEVTGHGFATRTRQCTVRRGRTTWCSLGVTLTDDSRTEIAIDERPEEEAVTDPTTGEEVPEALPDPTVSSFSGDALSSGCSAGGSESPAGLLLLLGGLFLFRRRSRAAVLVGSLGAMVGCSEAQPEAAASALTEGTSSDEAEVDAPTASIVPAQEVRSFATLQGAQVLAEADDVLAVTLSPTAAHLALSLERQAGVDVLDVQSRERRALVRQERSGLEPVWDAQGQRLGIRTPGQSVTAVPLLAFGLDGETATPLRRSQRAHVRSEAGAIVLRDAEGQETAIAPPGDRYFAPRLSSDEAMVAFQGLSTGLYLYRRSDGKLFHFGEGTNARFDGDHLFFERAIDDGQQVLSGALFVADLNSPELRFGRLEMERELALEVLRSPSVVNGNVAFLAGNQVVFGRVVFE